MKQVLIDALEKQYEAEIAEADVKIKLLFENKIISRATFYRYRKILSEEIEVEEAERELNLV